MEPTNNESVDTEKKEVAKATTRRTKREKHATGEMVVIELPSDGERYKDDLTIGLNGVMYKIKRGEPIKVPVAIAEIIRNSNEQRKRANAVIQRFQEQANTQSAEI